MNKIDEFKNFVKKNPELINNVKTEKMTWQKYYELYDLYGEDENIWKNYILKENNNENKTVNNASSKFNELLDMAKNIDVDKVQNGISSLQKAIGLFGEIFANKNGNSSASNNSYTPRPIYRKFDD